MGSVVDFSKRATFNPGKAAEPSAAPAASAAAPGSAAKPPPWLAWWAPGSESVDKKLAAPDLTDEVVQAAARAEHQRSLVGFNRRSTFLAPSGSASTSGRKTLLGG